MLFSVPRELLGRRSCNCRRVPVHECRERLWKAAAIEVTPIFVTLRTPRVICWSCGNRTWHQPQFHGRSRQVSKEFERSLKSWLTRLTIQDAVAAFGMTWNTVCEIDIKLLMTLPRRELSGLKRLAIDEVYLEMRQKFVTLVVDPDTRALVSVAPGRGQAGLPGFFLRLQRANVPVGPLPPSTM